MAKGRGVKGPRGGERVVKLQRPLSHGNDAPWLVYDEPRSFVRGLSPENIPAHVMKAMGNDPKAYFMVLIDGAHVSGWKRRLEAAPSW